MSKYYYLISSLPELSLDDSKLSYTVAEFKEELYSNLSTSDKTLIDLFYLKFDNENLLRLLRDKDAEIDSRGNYSAEELLKYIEMIRDGEKIYSSEFPSYLVQFISDYYYNDSDNLIDSILPEDKLAGLYYEYGMKNKNEIVSDWYEFNFNLNNILSAFTARKYKSEISYIVGNNDITEALRTSGARDFGLSYEIDYFDQIMKISEIDDLVEREKKIDLLRWEWLDVAIFFKYFSIERLFAYLIKLEMIERWLTLDAEKGRELFRKLIDALKDEVKIPDEFK